MVLANTLCVAPGCSEYPQGLTEFDGVPILDLVSTSVRMAEVMISLKRAGLPWISRKRSLSRPPDEIVRLVEARFPYHGSGSFYY